MSGATPDPEELARTAFRYSVAGVIAWVLAVAVYVLR